MTITDDSMNIAHRTQLRALACLFVIAERERARTRALTRLAADRLAEHIHHALCRGEPWVAIMTTLAPALGLTHAAAVQASPEFRKLVTRWRAKTGRQPCSPRSRHRPMR